MKRDFGRRIAQVALAVLMPTVALGIGTLMVGHWAPLPAPAAGVESPLAAGLRSTFGSAAPGLSPPSHEWRLVHVLYEECDCSARVLDHLLERPRAAGAQECLLLVHDDDGQANKDLAHTTFGAGIATRHVSQRELAERFGIQAAPLFVVVNADDEVEFCGGYTERKRGLAYLDLDVLAAIQSGRRPSPIPVFGCGVSRTLQDSLDPLGLKYR